MRLVPLFAALQLASFSAAASDCTQPVIEPTAMHLNVTMGGGLAYNRDSTSVAFAPGSFQPYVLNRIPLPLLGPVNHQLLLPSGAPFPVRYLDRAGASEDLTKFAVEVNDAPSADPEDDNGYVDIYRVTWIGQSPVYERISNSFSGGDSNGSSSSAIMSADGSRVMFSSFATNLTPNSPSARGIYVWKEEVGQLLLVTGSDGNGLACAGQSALIPRRFSRDGNRALVNCWGSAVAPHLWEVDVSTGIASVLTPPVESARYLVDGDDDLRTLLFFAYPSAGGGEQLHAWARDTGSWELISRRETGGVPDQSVGGGSITGDGRHVIFSTRATNVIGTDNGNFSRSYVVDRETGELAVVNGDGHGVPRADVRAFPARVGDRMMVFSTWASLSRHYNENDYNFLIGNPLKCDLSIWSDGFE